MNFNIYIGLTFLAHLIFINISYAQEDTSANNYRDQFDSFKKDIQLEFNGFQNQNDSIFLKFLDDSWREFELFQNERIPTVKPQIQPTIDSGIEEKEIETPIKGDQYIKGEKGNLHDDNEGNKSHLNEPTINASLSFYGIDLADCVKGASSLTLNSLTKYDIHSFFLQAIEDPGINESISLLLQNSEKHKLNDWGFLLLLKKASEKLFISTNNRKLYVWYGLLKSGYDTRVGFDKNNVFLLINASHSIYNSSYFKLDGNKYYIVRFKDDPFQVNKLIAHEFGYPNSTKAISLLLSKIPELKADFIERKLAYKGDTLNIPLNKNLLNFYKDYPDTDLELYFATPLSESVSSKLEFFFKDKLRGLDQVQVVDKLLDFIQSSIAYKNDFDQFGSEKYMFAEEALFYPFSDCEDRSVLFSNLVKSFTGLQTIGLNYPNHVSVGVSFDNQINGDYFLYDGKSFYICDPTYIGATSGICVKELRNIKPKPVIYE